MNILSIGNSFSQDAQRYLHGIAKADGVKLNAFNLYIGGCPLSAHYRNMLSEQREYTLEMNGQSTGFKVSLREALLNRDWDVITVQQASHFSTDYSTYKPYLNKLAEYIRDCAPKAKIAVHQTWAYEQDSQRLNVMMGYSSHTDMFKDIKRAYKNAADDIKADLVIPAGEVFSKIVTADIGKAHRDTFHASLGIGRYALGLIWYAALTGRDVKTIDFADFDEEVSCEQREIIKKCVTDVFERCSR